MQLGELDLSRALQEVSVSLDQGHGLHVLGGKNMALINSLHLDGRKTRIPHTPAGLFARTKRHALRSCPTRSKKELLTVRK